MQRIQNQEQNESRDPENKKIHLSKIQKEAFIWQFQTKKSSQRTSASVINIYYFVFGFVK